jgi:hypothetical protein
VDQTERSEELSSRCAHLHSDATIIRQHLSLPAAPAALLGLEWFPFASYARPETFCFVKSVRDLPVQLIDGNTGKVSTEADFPSI